MEGIFVRDIVRATGGRLLCGREDTPIAHISIDSRAVTAQDLFVPLVGEKVDAHKFLSQAEGQAAAVLTSEHDAMDSETAWIRVEDTKKALQDIGAYYREKLTLPLVGITGSVGKTTTREMVAAALSAGFSVFKTPGNHNSQVGVPLTLSEITKRDEIGVIELGMSEPGEMTVIAQIARVNMAVITNIGITHIEQLGSQQKIYEEKLHIQDGMAKDGTLVLNGDDELLKNTKAAGNRKTVYYGTGEHCDYRAVDIHTKDGFPVFTAVHGDTRAEVSLKVMGSHQVLNAMAAISVACEYGVSMEGAARALGEYTGFQGRQQIYHEHGMTIIDDTYNASPVSMIAGLDVLRNTEGGRKIAVLADMKELGPEAARFHREVGETIKDHPVDLLLLLGELAGYIGEGAGFCIRQQHFTDREQLKAYLADCLKPGDCILLKGSNSMKLGEVADFVRHHASTLEK